MNVKSTSPLWFNSLESPMIGHYDTGSGNIMASTVSSQITLGHGDKSDYHFLWSALDWAAPLFWFWQPGTP